MIRFETQALSVAPWPAAILAGSLFLVAMAQVNAETLDFKQSVAIALKQNPDLMASRSQIAQAEGALREAKGNRLPKLTASLTATHSDDPLNVFGMTLSQRRATFGDFGAGQFNPADPNILTVAPRDLNYPDAATNYNTRLELQVPVYNGGMVRGYIDQARAFVAAAQQGDAAARQQVVFQVLQAYEGIHAARAFVEVAEKGRAASEAYVKTTENLVTRGIVVRSDLLSAQVHLEDVKVQLQQARNGEAAALDQLHLLLGMPLNEPLDVAGSYMPAPAQGNIASLKDEALASNPGVRALRHQLDAAAANVKVARATRRPHFNIMARQDWNDDTPGFGASSYTVGGVLSWQLFDGGATRGAIDRAAASRTELTARLQQAESGIGFKVDDAKRKADEAQKRVAARELAVSQAEEAQRLISKRYENGVSTAVEVLSAQAQLDKARADLVSARYELAVQRAALLLAVGKLEPNQL